MLFRSTLANVVEKLKSSEHYNSLFSKVHSDGEITGQRTLLALTQFVVMFNSYNSKYDKYIRNESENTFTRQEKNGLQIFRQHCATCHTEPLFTNNQFENNGLKVDTTLNDYGRYFITNNQKDSLKFKVPCVDTLSHQEKSRISECPKIGIMTLPEIRKSGSPEIRIP